LLTREMVRNGLERVNSGVARERRRENAEEREQLV
jgi:hypothetical protein